MTSNELLRLLRRAGATFVADRGKGGHVMVMLAGWKTFVPAGGREVVEGYREIAQDHVQCARALAAPGRDPAPELNR